MNSGIYLITNMNNGQKYIGQTTDFTRRFAQHRFNAKEKDLYLYRSMRHHGIENFKFDILVVCDMEYANLIEPKMIAAYNTLAPNGYNSLEGGKNSPHNEITKQIISEARIGKGLWKGDPDRVRGMQGKSQSDHQKDAVTKANQRDWKIITPTGQSFIISNLNKWAKENGLDQANLARGGNGRHKGYQAIRQ